MGENIKYTESVEHETSKKSFHETRKQSLIISLTIKDRDLHKEGDDLRISVMNVEEIKKLNK